MRRCLAAILLAAAPVHVPEAGAGAWPRDEGAAFLSLSQTVSTGGRTLLSASEDIRSYTSLYAEYGLTPKLTIGLDAGVGIDASLSTGMESPVNAWLAFLRYPIWVGEGGNRFAAQIGAGTQTEPDYGQQARLRPGLSWGRGFESRWGGGWFGIEASAEYRFKSEDFAFKADYTAGIKPSEKWMLIFQLQTGRYGAEDTIVRLAPSVVRKMGKRMHLQLGGIASVAGDDALGLKFATWFEF